MATSLNLLPVATRARFFLNDYLSDVILMVGTGNNFCRLPSHSAILSAASNVWKEMLGDDVKPNVAQEIVLDGVDTQVFIVLLRCVYTGAGSFRTTVWTEAVQVLELADKFGINEIKDRCQDILSESLSLRNYGGIFQAAKKYNLPSLKDKCVELVLKLGGLALESEEFLKVDCDSIEKIASSVRLVVPSELVVLRAIWRWVKIDCCYRGLAVNQTMVVESLGELLRHIRYNDLTDPEMTAIPLQIVLHMQGYNAARPRCGFKEGFLNVPRKWLTEQETEIDLMSNSVVQAVTKHTIECIRFTLDNPAYLLNFTLVWSSSTFVYTNIHASIPLGTTNYDLGMLEMPILSGQRNPVQSLGKMFYTCKKELASPLQLLAGQEYCIQASQSIPTRNVQLACTRIGTAEICCPYVYTSEVLRRQKFKCRRTANACAVSDAEGTVQVTVRSRTIAGIVAITLAPVLPSTYSVSLE